MVHVSGALAWVELTASFLKSLIANALRSVSRADGLWSLSLMDRGKDVFLSVLSFLPKGLHW